MGIRGQHMPLDSGSVCKRVIICGKRGTGRARIFVLSLKPQKTSIYFGRSAFGRARFVYFIRLPNNMRSSARVGLLENAMADGGIRKSGTPDVGRFTISGFTGYSSAHGEMTYIDGIYMLRTERHML